MYYHLEPKLKNRYLCLNETNKVLTCFDNLFYKMHYASALATCNAYKISH